MNSTQRTAGQSPSDSAPDGPGIDKPDGFEQLDAESKARYLEGHRVLDLRREIDDVLGYSPASVAGYEAGDEYAGSAPHIFPKSLMARLLVALGGPQ